MYPILNLPIIVRRIIFILIDCLNIALANFISFLIIYPPSDLSNFGLRELNKLVILSLLIGSVIYFFTGQYRGITKYTSSNSLYSIALRNLLLTIILFIFSINLIDFKIGFFLVFWLALSNLGIAIRVIIRDFIFKFELTNSRKRIRVAIYGAGEAGAQLANSLKLSGRRKPVIFLDDKPNLWGRTLSGIPIKSPKKLHKYIRNIDQILLAIPSLNRVNKKSIINSLEKEGVSVMTIPSIDEITSGRATIDSIKPISIEDLLGRNPVQPELKLFNKLNNFNVLVTGAGGSIGSELCKEILNLNPKNLILFERNEPSLYKISQLLALKENKKTKIHSVLGDTLNFSQLKKIFLSTNIDLVFHAAAYKHVPLVEKNPLEGVHNNVISTLNLCKISEISNVKKMILISTDKAVRPTNIMGASKRISEMIVQGFANIELLKSSSNKTCFSMVRFGNVLDSSGSVVPLFREQIARGGPLTVTHDEIIRYFMTIKEAAQLVLQASTMAKGGEVFLLDMGEPVKIINLAYQMIKLSGLSPKDSENPNGDLEVKIIGLRPGEKLYEELLVDAKSIPTEHALIFKAKEKFINSEKFWNSLELLEDYINKQDKNALLSLLFELVPEWRKSKLIK